MPTALEIVLFLALVIAALLGYGLRARSLRK
jgi:hypothetical protein